jgi:hypothetical protein
VGDAGNKSKLKGLKFELWHNGVAVNPLNYISF